MKVSIDSILNTAVNIKNQKDNFNNKSENNAAHKAAGDSIEIRSKLSSRLGRIQSELKNLQSSLTKNQIIKDGLSQVINDLDSSAGRINRIAEQVRFEKKLVLNDFLDNAVGSFGPKWDPPGCQEIHQAAQAEKIAARVQVVAARLFG